MDRIDDDRRFEEALADAVRVRSRAEPPVDFASSVMASLPDAPFLQMVPTLPTARRWFVVSLIVGILGGLWAWQIRETWMGWALKWTAAFDLNALVEMGSQIIVADPFGVGMTAALVLLVGLSGWLVTSVTQPDY